MSTTDTTTPAQRPASPAAPPTAPEAPPVGDYGSVWGAPPAGPSAEILHGAAPTRRWLPAVVRTKIAAGLTAAGLLVGGTAGYAVGHSAGAGGSVPAGQTGRPGGTTGQGGFGGPPGQQGQSGTTGQQGTTGQPGSGTGQAGAGQST